MSNMTEVTCDDCGAILFVRGVHLVAAVVPKDFGVMSDNSVLIKCGRCSRLWDVRLTNVSIARSTDASFRRQGEDLKVLGREIDRLTAERANQLNEMEKRESRLAKQAELILASKEMAVEVGRLKAEILQSRREVDKLRALADRRLDEIFRLTSQSAPAA